MKTPDTCPSCESLPRKIHPLPFGRPYHSHVSDTTVTPMLDDYRCRWCQSQWNERERASGVLRVVLSRRY